MHHSDETLRTLEQFAGMGIAVAVDDFGIGHSSLSYLKRFPVDTLKIDKSFLREVEGDGDNLAIVTAIVALGRSLQLDVLAEGVETAAQLKVLRGLGCDGAQGLYFSEPVPADQVPGLFRQYEVS
jgi:EAL domain-containing protein (putative c-di-GMP-specific phosphodiesterase class I)